MLALTRCPRAPAPVSIIFVCSVKNWIYICILLVALVLLFRSLVVGWFLFIYFSLHSNCGRHTLLLRSTRIILCRSFEEQERYVIKILLNNINQSYNTFLNFIWGCNSVFIFFILINPCVMFVKVIHLTLKFDYFNCWTLKLNYIFPSGFKCYETFGFY